MAWQLQTAKQHFSELVERARTEGPQVVTKHGKEAVVVVSAEEYRKLRGTEPSLVEFIRAAPDLDLLELDRAADHGRDGELRASCSIPTRSPRSGAVVTRMCRPGPARFPTVIFI